MKTKEDKGLKTKRYGKTKREFHCTKRLQTLLKEIREKQGNPNPKSKVFLTREGNPVCWYTFYHCWVGKHDGKRNIDGVIEILGREGKVGHYLKPYATRHSFITWQLATGTTPANVAIMVGNTPEVIYKYYVSGDKNAKPTYELEEFPRNVLEI